MAYHATSESVKTSEEEHTGINSPRTHNTSPYPPSIQSILSLKFVASKHAKVEERSLGCNIITDTGSYIRSTAGIACKSCTNGRDYDCSHGGHRGGNR